MRTDTEVRVKGIETLIHAMGEVDAERFISLLMRESFDYTVYQRSMLNDVSLQDISKMAMEHRRKMNK